MIVSAAESFGRCGECTKIEGPLLMGRRCHPKSGTSCNLAGTIFNSSDSKGCKTLTTIMNEIFC